MNLKLQTNEQLSVTAKNGLAGVFVNGTSLSANLSAKADLTALQNYYPKSETSAASEISTALKKTVHFDNRLSSLSGYDSLEVITLSADEYAQMLEDGTQLSNAIYIVDAPNINAFQQRVVNVAPAVDLSDAVNLEQLISAVGSIELTDYYPKSETSSASQISTALTSYYNKNETSSNTQLNTAFSNYYKKTETSSASQISIALEEAGNKVYFDNRISGFSGRDDLSVVRLSADEYATMLHDNTCVSNAIYIVDAPALNAFRQRITNVAPAVDLSDAVNLEQLSAAIDNVQIPSDLSAFTNSPGYLSAVPSTYKTYDNTVTALTATSDFKTYAQTKSSLSSDGYLLTSDVKLSYSNQTIWLSSKAYVTSVDCADFIKDGMLSSAELCNTTLVLTFNTDAESAPISVELSNFVDNYDSKIAAISGSVDSKAEKTELAPLFNAASAYAVGEMVTYENVTYECISAHSGAWDSADFRDSTMYEYVGNIEEALDEIIGNGRMPMDYGYLFVETAPTNVGGTQTITLSNYCTQTYVCNPSDASYVQTFTIAPPSGTTDRTRDMVLILDCSNVLSSSDLPIVTWTSAFHPRTTSIVDMIAEIGAKNVFYVSEYSSGQFVVGKWLETAGGYTPQS